MKKAFSPQRAFYLGNYQEILDHSVDSAGGSCKLPWTPWVIGALVFRGRLEEAEWTYQRFESRMSFVARVEACFFLGEGFTRHSQYAKGRHYLGKFLRKGSCHRNPRIRFFTQMGLGFYRYFSGRFERAAWYGRRAFRAACDAGFPFGKSFGADLLGHALVQMGQISEGLRYVEEGVRYARASGEGGWHKAFSMTVICYRAQFGIGPSSLKDLENAAKTETFLDTYTHSGLNLELSRQYMLRGDLELAKQILDSICAPIYQARHRRQGFLLSFRYATLAYLQGDTAYALNGIRAALKELDLKIDRALEVEGRGLEYLLADRLGLHGELAGLRDRIVHLTRLTGKGTSKHIATREWGTPTVAVIHDDPVGHLMDTVKSDPELANELIWKTGYFGLLYETLSLERRGRFLYFDPQRHTVVALDQGNVFVASQPTTPLIRVFLRELALGNCAKADLVAKIWRYRYHPLTHDPLIYRMVSRCRHLLGSRGGWIEVTEEGYRLKAGVQLIQARALAPSPAASPQETDFPSEPELNFRQIRAIQILRLRDFINVADYIKEFDVSPMTARRDLVGLIQANRLRRIGKGRAICYTAKGC